MSSRVLDKIESDPVLTEKYLDRFMDKMFGLPPESRDDGDNFDFNGDGGMGDNPIRAALDQLRDVEDFKKEMKLGKGSSIFTADVISEAIGLARDFMGNQRRMGNAPNSRPLERAVLVNIDGQVQEVPESQYRRMLTSGQVQPVMLTAPKPVVEPTPTPPVKPIVEPVVQQGGAPVAPVAASASGSPSAPVAAAGSTETPPPKELEMPKIEGEQVVIQPLTKERVIAFLGALNYEADLLPYLEQDPEVCIVSFRETIEDFPFMAEFYTYLGETDYDNLMGLAKDNQHEQGLSDVWPSIAEFLKSKNKNWMVKFMSLCKEPLEREEGRVEDSELIIGDEGGKLI